MAKRNTGIQSLMSAIYSRVSNSISDDGRIIVNIDGTEVDIFTQMMYVVGVMDPELVTDQIKNSETAKRKSVAAEILKEAIKIQVQKPFCGFLYTGDANKLERDLRNKVNVPIRTIDTSKMDTFKQLNCLFYDNNLLLPNSKAYNHYLLEPMVRKDKKLMVDIATEAIIRVLGIIPNRPGNLSKFYVPSIDAYCYLTVYYWIAVSNVLDKVNLQVLGIPGISNGSYLRASSNFKTYLNSYLKDKKHAELAYKFILDSTDNGMIYNIYLYHDKLIDMVYRLQQNDDNENVKKSVDKAIKYVIDDVAELSKTNLMLNKKRITTYSRFLVVMMPDPHGGMTKDVILRQLTAFEFIDSYNNDSKLTPAKNEVYKAMFMHYQEYTGAALRLASVFASGATVLSSAKVSELSTKVGNSEAQAAEAIERYEDIKGSRDQLRSENKKLRNQLIDCRNQLELANRQLSNVITAQKYNDALSEMARKDRERDRLIKEIDIVNKQLIKVMDEKSRIYEANKNRMLENAELQERLKVCKDELVELNMIKREQDIELSAYVNALKNKNIAMLGGFEVLIAELGKLGFKNIKFYNPGFRGLNNQDIINLDLFILCANKVSHSASMLPMNICREHDVKILYFNDTKARLLVYEMFNMIYKD